MAAPDPAATGSAAAGPTAPDPAAIGLFGLVAYGELLAFDRLAADARLAPDLGRRAALSEMAAAEIAHYRWLTDRLAGVGRHPGGGDGPLRRGAAGVPRLDRAAGLGGGGDEGVRG